MKRLLCALGVCFAFLLFSTTALASEEIATSGVCGENVTWTLDEDSVLTISGTGPMYDYGAGDDDKCPWAAYTDITRIVIEDGVTRIGSHAFLAPWYHLDYANIEVSIADTVTSIGDNAFVGRHIVGDLVIPGSVKEIELRAFGSATSTIDSLTLSEGIERIGDYAFIGGCSADEIILPSSLEYLGSLAFMSSTVKSLTILSDNLFCDGGCFMDCANLESINIPSGTRFADGSRDSLIGGKTKTAGPIGSGCDIEYGWTTEIPDWAFNSGISDENYGLEIIYVPNTIQHIGTSAFYSPNLTDIYYDGYESQWNSIEFSDLPYDLYPEGVTLHFKECPGHVPELERDEHCHYYVCKICGERLSESVWHIWSDWWVSLWPSFGFDGTLTHRCLICDFIDVISYPWREPDRHITDAIDREIEAILDGYHSDEDEELAESIRDAASGGFDIFSEPVNVELPVEDVSDDEKAAIDNELREHFNDNYGVGGYFDLSILIVSERDNDRQTLGALKQLQSGVIFTIDIPQDLRRSGREFHIVRIHDGAADILQTTNNGNGTLSFRTDRFSTYAIAYVDDTESGDSDTKPVITVPSETYDIVIAETNNGQVRASLGNASKGANITITTVADDGYALTSITVTDDNGNLLTLDDIDNGQYRFTMPESDVTIEALFAPVQFSDVSTNDYYYDAVQWAVSNNITSGMTNSTFGPDASCTRAQLVTFLWRAAGSPSAAISANPFTDVSEGSYYYDAVMWAVSNGITEGITDTTFSPNVVVSRAQAVTFLWRMSGSTENGDTNQFVDVDSSAYYFDAVIWACSNGVTSGVTETRFDPNADCTRAQTVTFIFRALANV